MITDLVTTVRLGSYFGQPSRMHEKEEGVRNHSWSNPELCALKAVSAIFKIYFNRRLDVPLLIDETRFLQSQM